MDHDKHLMNNWPGWNEPDPVEVDFDRIVGETDLAFLVEIDGEEYWLPKSQCEIDEGGKTVSMPEWLAEEKGLI